MSSSNVHEPLGQVAAAVASLCDETVALADELGGGVIGANLRLIANQLDRVRSLAILADRAAARKGDLPRRVPGEALRAAQEVVPLAEQPDLRLISPTGQVVIP